MLKKPISLKEIKDKLDTRTLSVPRTGSKPPSVMLMRVLYLPVQYRSFPDVRTDFNQVFVNAKRYNAPGSPIFVDAKRLHKVMREAYAIMTGEVEPPREEEPEAPEPVVVEQSAPPPDTGERGDDAKRATQLKPWLLKKLQEATHLYDSDGRRLADVFEKLPDRNMWPDYYQIIANPQSFSTVKYRVTHRYYATAASFIDDVNLIFANALYYNEESSGIAQDALRLRQHFAQVMREPPPPFIPPREPRKYTKREPKEAKQKRQASAAPTPQPVEQATADDQQDGSDAESEDEMSRHGSVAPDGNPGYGEPGPADPYSLQATYASTSTELHSYTAAVAPNGLSSAAGPVYGQGEASPSFQNPALAGLAGSPSLANGAAARPGIYSTPSNEGPRVPRHIAKVPSGDEVPSVTRIDVAFSSPSASGPKMVVLDNSTIRQHSLSVPFGTDRVEIAFHIQRGGKGKAKAENGLTASDDPVPQITAATRPKTLELAEVTEATTNAGAMMNGADLSVASAVGSDGAIKRKYAFKPRVGLNVFEVLIKAPGAADGDAEEVFRVFVTR